MATIIGKDPKVMRRCTCAKCASIIEYTLSEVKLEIECDYGGGHEKVAKLTCPGCGTNITVDKY